MPRYEKCCGAVVYRREAGEIKYLMIQSRNGTWGFPKGHVEEGETELTTALREVQEETGLRISITEGFRTEEVYTLIEGSLQKQVVYFLGTFKEQEPVRQESEINDIRLLEYEEARKLLQYPSLKRILREAAYFLKHKGEMK